MNTKKIIASALSVATLLTTPCVLNIGNYGGFADTAIVASAATSTTVEYTTGSITYVLDTAKKTAAIKKYTGASTSVTIPVSISYKSASYKVSSMYEKAFKDSKVKSVNMTSARGVVMLPYQAFQGCTALTTIKLPSTMKSINTQAFYGCTALTTITIPKNMKNIWHDAFNNCTALKTVTLADGCALEFIGNYAFRNCKNLTKLDFTTSLASDSNYIYMSDKITNIGTNAFMNCTGISKIYLNDKKNIIIGSGAFNTGNSNIHIVTRDDIGPSDVSVSSTRTAQVKDSYGNVYVCEALDMDPAAGAKIRITGVKSKTVSVPSTVTINGVSHKVVEIESEFLKGNTTVTKVTFPSTVKTIGQFTCADTTALTQVVLPSSLQKIGYASFYNASALKKVSCSSTVLKEVDEFCFGVTPWRDKFKTNYPSAEALMLGTYLMEYYGKSTSSEINLVCSNTLVTYNGGTKVNRKITAIGREAFKNCSKLKTIDLSGVLAIGDKAFKTNSKLESVYNTNSIVILGKDLFHANTLKKLKEETNNKNYIMMGTALYQWLGTGTTADLTSNTKLNFISANVFPGTSVTTIKLPKNTNLYIADKAFKDSKITSLYYNGKKLSYSYVKNNSYGMKDFYMSNYAGLEGCKATYTQLIQPMCKAYLTEMGLTYYGKVNTSLTAAQQVKIASTIYRYLSKKITYEIIYSKSGAIQSSGAYTLLTSIGACWPQSHAYAYLLNCAGVSSQTVTGPGHAWNVIKIGTKWMHADVCWKSIDHWFLRTTSEFKSEDSSCHIYDGYADEMCLAYGIGTTTKQSCNQSMGDVNGDGVLNNSDVSMLNTYLNYSVKMTKPEYADLNGDGKINTIDRAFLQTRLARK